jgi:alkylation response protein AidB-like acyl-CoA dehydrogenase
MISLFHMVSPQSGQQAAKCPAQYQLAEALEQYLGNPLDEAEVFSFKRAVELDERDEYPAEACRLLDEWNFSDYYVPQEHGGKLESYQELLALIRVIARRDLTTAVAHVKTYLGAVSVWIAGTEEQIQKVAQRIKNGEQVALALTEQKHGSDLLSSEVEAVSVPDGYLLSGEKWLINNATRSTALTVFARTDVKRGARGFSIFLVEKKNLHSDSYQHLPREKTHGLRGADISGIRFNKAALPAQALIGSRGSGLELMLKGFQITRSIVPALSLGAADTALRTTLSFALTRKLYGDTVFAIAQARSTLVDAFLDLLICECQTIAVTRALHIVPEQMTLFSAIVKYYVPTTIEKMIRNLAGVLGARYYLREGHWCGIFQKILRDNAIASLFDGSTAVNLKTIALQLRHPATNTAKTKGGPLAKLVEANVEAIFGLASSLPVFAPAKLQLTNRGRNDILHGLELSRSHLERLTEDPDLDTEVLSQIIALTDGMLAESERLHQNLVNLARQRDSAFEKSAECFELSKKYCVVQAAAVCVQLWIHNRSFLDGFFSRGEWLVLSLDRLLTTFDPVRTLHARPYLSDIAQHLADLYEKQLSLSIIPFQLA